MKHTNRSSKPAIQAIALAALLPLFASCDTKSCRCYVYDGLHDPYKQIEYVQEGTPCSSLDYNRGAQYRTCVEINEPDIDPGDIGQEYKKR